MVKPTDILWASASGSRLTIFPSMVPLWMFPVAIICGNTFVLKPSEKVPLSAMRLAELLQSRPDCRTAFLTSSMVTKKVSTRCSNIPRSLPCHSSAPPESPNTSTKSAPQHGKRVQSAGGAKNHLIIMPDADISQAVKALAASAYGCAGQRCMAGSVAVTVGSAGDPLVDTLCGYAGGFHVGATDGGTNVDMGPLINHGCGAIVSRPTWTSRPSEGAEVALDGREKMGGEGFLIGPSVVDKVKPDMKLATEEIFGPVLSVIRTDRPGRSDRDWGWL